MSRTGVTHTPRPREDINLLLVVGILRLANDRIDLYKHVYGHSEISFRVLSSSGAAAAPAICPAPLRAACQPNCGTQIFLYGLIHRASNNDRIWNERPSAGVLRSSPSELGKPLVSSWRTKCRTRNAPSSIYVSSWGIHRY